MPEKNLPMVRLCLGEDFETIQRRSSLRLLTKRTELLDMDLLGSDQPMVLEYQGAGCGFTLPPARSYSSVFLDGHAVNVAIAPHLAYLSKAEAFALAHHLTETFDRAGWKLTQERFTLEATQEKFSDPATESEFALEVFTRQCGRDALRLKIERHEKEGQKLPNRLTAVADCYVVTVNITNDAIYTQYDNENDRKRQGAVGERKIPVKVEPAAK